MPAPPRALSGDAAEPSTGRGLHGFTSLQKHINSHHLCLNKSLSLTARYGTTCAALPSATAHKGKSSGSDWCQCKVSVINDSTEKTEQRTKLNPQTAVFFFSGTENFFLNSVWQLIQPSCTLKLHGQKGNYLLALYNCHYSMLVWGQNGYRIRCT